MQLSDRSEASELSEPSERSDGGERSEPVRIGVSNQKGGVGKSTTTLNVAGGLSELGYQVGVVDADPQGHLTDGAGLHDAYGAESPSLYDALKNPGEHSFTDLVYDHPEFDLIPSNVDMFTLPLELMREKVEEDATIRDRLDKLLSTATGYDYLVIDAPPSLMILNDNVLLACDDLIIPADPKDTTIKALDLLLGQIESLEREHNTTIRERAMVINAIDYPTDKEQQGMIDWINREFSDQLPIYEIAERVAIRRAWIEGRSVFEHEEDCDQQDTYLALAKQIEEIHG